MVERGILRPTGAKLPTWRMEPGQAEHNGSASSALADAPGSAGRRTCYFTDGGGIVADPLTPCPVQVPFRPCVLCITTGALRYFPRGHVPTGSAL